MKKLRKYLLLLMLAGFLIGSPLLAYTYFIEPYQLVVKEISLSVPNWDAELNGFKIAAMSDLHGGSHTVTEERIQSLASQITAQNPDVIVLLGDFVSQIHEDKPNNERDLKMPVETIAKNLAGLRAKYGVYVVIGNHDWWYSEDNCRKAFESVGFTVLENQTKSFEVNGKTVSVLGIEDFWKRRTVDVKEALEKLPLKRNIIGITHNPDSFDHTPDFIALLLAGHTHGGQVNFPLLGAPIVPAKKEYTAGHVVKNGRHLFVTSGIGTSGLPFRFRVPPEIVFITLNGN